jgi:Zn-dependent protease
VEQPDPVDPEEPRRGSPLPPEVEAELRRRFAASSAAGGDPSLPLASEAGRTEPGTADTPLAQRLRRMGPLGFLLLFLMGKAKTLLLLLKFGLPVLKTGGTMLLSMAFYAMRFGWRFSAGFVLGILAHEMGHVFVAWRMGIPVTAPIFIPGFGALILQKQRAKSAWDEALIGIGGPLAGTAAGLLYLFLAYGARSPLLLALAYTTFAINLFNLAPIFPLDGGWITGAVSPRLWLIGLVGLVLMFASGTLRNPLILLLLFFSLPRLLHGLKTGDVTPPGGEPTTPRQRLLMSLAYLSLCTLLFWLMAYVRPGD